MHTVSKPKRGEHVKLKIKKQLSLNWYSIGLRISCHHVTGMKSILRVLFFVVTLLLASTVAPMVEAKSPKFSSKKVGAFFKQYPKLQKVLFKAIQRKKENSKNQRQYVGGTICAATCALCITLDNEQVCEHSCDFCSWALEGLKISGSHVRQAWQEFLPCSMVIRIYSGWNTMMCNRDASNKIFRLINMFVLSTRKPNVFCWV